MLAAVRAFAKSWFAKVLIALVMLSFLAIGARTGLPSRLNNDVVTAGDRHVSAPEFKQIFDNYMQEVQQQNGQATIQEAVANGMDKRVAQEIATSEALAAFVRSFGVHPADQQVADILRQQKAFFDPVTGAFDQKAYQSWLTQHNLTTTKFEDKARSQIAAGQLAAGLAAGMRAPAIYAALIAGYELENRDLSYFIVDQRNVPPVPPPTDPDLQAFVKQNAAKLMAPELRILTIVRFSAKALAPTMPADDAEVRKLFDMKKGQAAAPEKRSLVEIPVKDQATAEAVSKRLKAGEAPAAVARSVGAQPITYTDAPKDAVADPSVANAAFGLKAGEASGPVQSSMAGWAVVAVQSVTPAKSADFEAMRADLETEVKTKAAQKKVYDEVQKFEDAHGGGASIADAAKAAGVEPLSVGPIAANGGTETGQPAQGVSDKLLKDAFGLGPNGETEVEEDGSGEYYLVHVDKIIAPAPPSLQDPGAKAMVAKVYMMQQMLSRLESRAGELADAARKGQGLDAAAASVGAQVQHAQSVTRAQMAKNTQMNPQLAQRLFTAKPGDILSGRTGQFAFMVLKVDAVRPPDQASAAPIVANYAPQVSQMLFDDLAQGLQTAANAAIKPQVHMDRADAALGLAPDELPKTSGGTAAPQGPSPAGKAP
jgi:peptidyl-prolyl cis-trans isomerase D